MVKPATENIKFEFDFSGPSKREREILIKKCIKALEGNDDRDFYQATAAAEYVGKDERLIKPLIKAYKRRRGWKRWLVLEALKYLKYHEKILSHTKTKIGISH